MRASRMASPLLFRPKTQHACASVVWLLSLAAPWGRCSVLMGYVRSPLARGMQDPVEQPIQFDHRHHTRDEGIDCRFCHTTVDRSPHAGIPDSQLCLNCHSQIWNQSPLLEPLRRSYFEGKPIVWEKVNDVPDFVYFNHAIHVNKGVGCVTCHGRVDEMAAVAEGRAADHGLVPRLSPQAREAPAPGRGGHQHGLAAAEDDAVAVGTELKEQNQVHTRTSCTTCHR